MIAYISAILNSFKNWKRNVEIVLGCISLKQGLTMVFSEVNLASVPTNMWWLDSGATSNISVSMKGCISYQKPIDYERWIYVGDGKSVEVDAIGNFRLLLCTRFYLDLKETFVVSSFRRNLVLVSYLDKFVFIWKQLI